MLSVLPRRCLPRVGWVLLKSSEGEFWERQPPSQSPLQPLNPRPLPATKGLSQRPPLPSLLSITVGSNARRRENILVCILFVVPCCSLQLLPLPPPPPRPSFQSSTSLSLSHFLFFFLLKFVILSHSPVLLLDVSVQASYRSVISSDSPAVTVWFSSTSTNSKHKM